MNLQKYFWKKCFKSFQVEFWNFATSHWSCLHQQPFNPDKIVFLFCLPHATQPLKTSFLRCQYKFTAHLEEHPTIPIECAPKGRYLELPQVTPWNTLELGGSYWGMGRPLTTPPRGGVKVSKTPAGFPTFCFLH